MWTDLFQFVKEAADLSESSACSSIISVHQARLFHFREFGLEWADEGCNRECDAEDIVS